MSRFSRAAFALVGLGTLGIATWAFFAPRQVTLNIANESQKAIAHVRVVDESATYELDGVGAGQASVFEFEPRGETTYSLVATFADGSVVQSEAAYAEAGYMFTVTITEASIGTRFDGMRHL